MGELPPFPTPQDDGEKTGSSPIIQFSSSKPIRPNTGGLNPEALQSLLAHEAEQTEMKRLALLQYSPSLRVKEILATRPNACITTSLSDLKSLLDNYFWGHLKKANIPLEQQQFITIEYLENLLLDFFLLKPRAQEIQDDPYVFDWMQREEYKMAGDVALYGYLFFYQFRQNRTTRLSRQDYLEMACRCYEMWNNQNRHRANAGGALADHLGYILPTMKHFPDDLFR